MLRLRIPLLTPLSQHPVATQRCTIRIKTSTKAAEYLNTLEKCSSSSIFKLEPTKVSTQHTSDILLNAIPNAGYYARDNLQLSPKLGKNCTIIHESRTQRSFHFRFTYSCALAYADVNQNLFILLQRV